MPFGIRPSNVRVCHSTTRAYRASINLSVYGKDLQVALVFVALVISWQKSGCV